MKEIRLLSTTAILGYGFPEESFRRGLAARPHVLAVDAGSSDPGPAYLGMGKSFTDRAAVRRDLKLMIEAGLDRGIPVIVGTMGGSGARPHVEWGLEIVEDIARELRRTLRAAVIYSDVKKSAVLRELRAGRIEPLPFAPALTEASLKATPRVVAQIGVEPLLEALEKPVDVVIAGRCYDPAVFAALPIREGFDRALALHLGKILECAAIAATPGSGRDCVLGVLRKDHFEVRTLSPDRRFTPDSVAAHTLYEKSHPSLLPGPGGVLDLGKAAFEAVDERSVRVRGSRYIHDARPRLKLEGSRRAGFRAISICGVRDRIMLSQLDSIFEGVRAAVANNFGLLSARVQFRVYGRDGVMGPLEPLRGTVAHEVGIVLDVVADTQAQADTVCGFVRSTLLHFGYPGRRATAGNLAFPFSPSDIACGPVFDFSLYHLMDAAAAGPFPIAREILGRRPSSRGGRS